MQHLETVLPRNKKFDAYTGGVVNWRTAIVHYIAKAVGLCVKVEGKPLGTDRNIDRSNMTGSCAGSAMGGITARDSATGF